ncbi:hypothetical protein GOODEAATRI_028496 [Goodea atripinnis]|uniref:Uncharacterized protein n=1 Tax=Goodea atripinnis TaxID=208336 RepID=A0ABV0NHN2_9TELE
MFETLSNHQIQQGLFEIIGFLSSNFIHFSGLAAKGFCLLSQSVGYVHGQDLIEVSCKILCCSIRVYICFFCSKSCLFLLFLSFGPILSGATSVLSIKSPLK